MIRDLVLVAGVASVVAISGCASERLIVDKQISDCERMKVYRDEGRRTRIEMYDICGPNPKVPVLVQDFDGNVFADGRIYNYIGRN